MTKVRNGLVLLLAAGCVLAGLSMMSGPGDQPFFDFRTGGANKPKHTVPDLGPGRKYVTLTIVWKRSKPKFILYTVASTTKHLAQGEIAGGAAGSYNHNVPYVPGTYYSIGASSLPDRGDLNCLIAVDGKTYDTDYSSDGTAVNCFINGTG